MTSVLLYKGSEGKLSGYRVSGHAGFARAGQDIVCAAISFMSIACANALERVAGMKLSDGATVIAAGPAGSDAIVLTHTDRQTAKVTDAGEIPLKGRGTGGVRVTKFRDERALDFAYVGPEAGVSVVVGTEDTPSKPDPSPEPLTIPHTARDLVSRAVPRRILDVGFGRW